MLVCYAKEKTVSVCEHRSGRGRVGLLHWTGKGSQGGTGKEEEGHVTMQRKGQKVSWESWRVTLRRSGQCVTLASERYKESCCVTLVSLFGDV